MKVRTNIKCGCFKKLMASIRKNKRPLQGTTTIAGVRM